MREPIPASWFACCRTVRWQQDGDNRPLTLDCLYVNMSIEFAGGVTDEEA
jgi:hypothetical protein